MFTYHGKGWMNGYKGCYEPCLPEGWKCDRLSRFIRRKLTKVRTDEGLQSETSVPKFLQLINL